MSKVPDESKVRSKGYLRNKETIVVAFKKYQNKAEGWETELFSVITEFAKSKISGKLYDQRELAATHEDWAQDVVLNVWSKIDEFVGDRDDFYAWLNKICFLTGKAARRDSVKSSNSLVDLFVDSEDCPGAMEDNPLIYTSSSGEGYVYLKEIPDWILGRDRKILLYVLDGKSYKQIAQILGTTVNAIEHAIRKIRRKQTEEGAKMLPTELFTEGSIIVVDECSTSRGAAGFGSTGD